MATRGYDDTQVNQLLLQALETARGGIDVYTAAIGVARNEDLRKEWQAYLEETRAHEQLLLSVFAAVGLDPEARSPGRDVVAHQCRSLVQAIAMARTNEDPIGAELVACECVVLAETKGLMNRELIGDVAKHGKGEVVRVLKKVFDAVEEDEDHNLYRPTGWTRELWIHSLGFPAALPPPEEVRQVEAAIGASLAGQARGDML